MIRIFFIVLLTYISFAVSAQTSAGRDQLPPVRTVDANPHLQAVKPMAVVPQKSGGNEVRSAVTRQVVPLKSGGPSTGATVSGSAKTMGATSQRNTATAATQGKVAPPVLPSSARVQQAPKKP